MKTPTLIEETAKENRLDKDINISQKTENVSISRFGSNPGLKEFSENERAF